MTEYEGMDWPASQNLHQPSCQVEPVECHCSSTPAEAMTILGTSDSVYNKINVSPVINSAKNYFFFLK